MAVFTAIVQGLLCAGAAVYIHQVYKQNAAHEPEDKKDGVKALDETLAKVNENNNTKNSNSYTEDRNTTKISEEPLVQVNENKGAENSESYTDKYNTTHEPENKSETPVLSLEQLVKVNENKNTEDCKYYIDALNNILPQHQIDTAIRLSHFFAQIVHESGNLHYKEENLNYSAQGLRGVFPKYFPDDDTANKYARKPENIANRVYANRMGNRDEGSGDGWKYRGRGMIQLTGHDNYKACGEALKLDLLGSPDLLCQDPKVIVSSACWYWTSRGLNALADKDDILNITKKINGGTNGLEDREKKLAVAKKVFG